MATAIKSSAQTSHARAVVSTASNSLLQINNQKKKMKQRKKKK
jgi:hypothetical protein